jgi:3-phenylpropionate/trans-cinnamate dioxygenase ferredoxin component
MNDISYKYHKIGKVEDIPDGERVFFEIQGHSIVLFSLDGKFLAIDDSCSHDNGPIGDGEIEGEDIICPRHGARFDLRSGKVKSLPAVTDIAVFPVRILDGYVEVGYAE